MDARPPTPSDGAPATEPSSPIPASPPPPRAPLQALLAAPVTALLSLVNVVVFVLAERTGRTTDTATLLAWGADWRWAVWGGEWWRLGTSMFLHIGLLHLVWNTWAGWGWCSRAEPALGRWRFLGIYLASGVAGAALSVIGHDAVAAGASGALFGVIGAHLVLTRRAVGSWREALRQRSRDVTMMAFWFLAGPWAGWDNWAHGGGLLAGLLLTDALTGPRSWRTAAAPLAVGLLLIASLHPLAEADRQRLRGMRAEQAAARQAWRDVLAELEGLDPAPELRAGVLQLRMQALAGLGDVDGGIALASAELARSRTPEVLMLRAQALEQAGDVDAGLRDYDEVLQQVPGHLEARLARASLTVRCCPDAAQRDAEAALQLDPANGLAHALRAELLAGQGLFAGAGEDLRLAREALPGNAFVAEVAAYVEQRRSGAGVLDAGR